MYGRGIVDDKGPACAAFFAMKELMDNGQIPEKCRVRLILGTDEERSCSCIKHYAAQGEVPDFAITPDSIFPVIYSEKGILQLRVFGENKNGLEAQGGTAINIVPNSARCRIDGKEFRAEGKAAHASKPRLGVNAISLLADEMEKNGVDLNDHPIMKFVKEFYKDELTGPYDENEFGSLTSNIGMLNADKDGCELRIDLRVPASVDRDMLIKNIRERALTYDLYTEVTLDLAPLSNDKGSPEVRKLTAIWERHMDRFTGFKEEYRQLYLEPKIEGMGTYARHIPNTIAFGIQAPWQSDQCHQTNEHAAVSDLVQWKEIIKDYILEFSR